mmetsp:Transcript_76771/g.203866  ORF Transcript_76771/g.203866 Transcript_76771/m.203866 type:complete len:676 (-) Transcript_76771:172-2199(-)
MLLDVIDVTLLHRQSLAGVRVAEALDKVLGTALARFREANPANALGHLRVDLHGGCRLEGRVASQQLERKDAQCPPVNCVGVPLRRDHLWSEIVRRPAGGERLAGRDLGQAHVCELDMPRVIEQEVLRLQVPVDDLLAVQMLERKGRARHVELRQGLLTPQVLLVVRCVQLTAQRQLQKKVERLVSVVRLVESHDEGRIAHHLDVLLAHDTGLHAGLDDIPLAECLQGVRLSRFDVLGHLHRAEATASKKRVPFELLARDLAETLHALLPPHWPHLQHGVVAVLAALLELLQGADQHVEGHLVHGEGRGGLRRDVDRGCARLVCQERSLTEELRLLSRGLEIVDLLAVLHDAHGAVYQDVEEVAFLALLEDVLILGEGHLVQRLGEFELLVVLERVQQLNLVQQLDVLLGRFSGCGSQDALELHAVNDHDGPVGLGCDRCCAWGEIHEGKLAEAHTLGKCRRRCCRRALGALRLARLLDLHFELALDYYVEVVGVEVALLDDLIASRHRLLPHEADHLLNLAIIQHDHSLQVLVAPQPCYHQLLLFWRLWARRLHLNFCPASPSHCTTLGKLQLLVEAQPLELRTVDAQKTDLSGSPDRCRPGLFAQQGVLAKVVAGLQLRDGVAVDLYATVALLDHEEHVTLFTLADDGRPSELHFLIHGIRKGRMLLLWKALE